MPELTRTAAHFADRLDGVARPIEAGRYRLVISRACPWASRVAITRRLMGLDAAISQAVTDPVQEQIDGVHQWVFTEATGSPGDEDPVLGIHRVQQAYQAREATYPGGESVPIVVDVPTGEIVTNDFGQLSLDLATEWGALARDGAPQLYPVELRDRIDELNQVVYDDINNGVYKAGFTSDQAGYETTVATLFARFDELETRLTGQRFLFGPSITESDIRLFVTLVRFDAVYHGHFKCNVAKLIEYPALWAYARDLFQTPGFGDTVDLDHIRRHYYAVHDYLNPTRVVARGPDPAQWQIPHHRDQLGGRPFGDGTPPPPPRPEDRIQAAPARPSLTKAAQAQTAGMRQPDLSIAAQ